MALKDIIITGSIGSFPTSSYDQKTYISSTDEQSFPIEQITGSSGGSTPNFNGKVSTNNLFINITQSWSGTIDSAVGVVNFTHDTEEEFINGEYSGSNLEVSHQRLIDDNSIMFLEVNTDPTNYKTYLYKSDNTSLGDFLDTSIVPSNGEILLFFNNLASPPFNPIPGPGNP